MYRTRACRLTAASIAATALLSGHAAANLVVNGDFRAGNTGFGTGYAYTAQPAETQYTIGTDPADASQYFGCNGNCWASFGDHTTGTGNMMIVNGADYTNQDGSNVSVWNQTVGGLTANTNYQFTAYAADIDVTNPFGPTIQLDINGTAGTAATLSTDPGKWSKITFDWNSGSSRSAFLNIVDTNISAGWNDFTLDDISFNGGAVPEPGSLPLLGAGLLAMMGFVRRPRT